MLAPLPQFKSADPLVVTACLDAGISNIHNQDCIIVHNAMFSMASTLLAFVFTVHWCMQGMLQDMVGMRRAMVAAQK